MAKLILMFNKQVIEEFPLEKDALKVGRKPENDIAIDNLAVSAFHVRIDKAGKDFILTDLQSTNGTFVNDKKIVTHKLKHGDNIIVGKHSLLFVNSDSGDQDTPSDEEKMDLDRTMLLDTVKQRELLAKQEILPFQQTEKTKKVGVLSFLGASSLGEVELTKKLTRIGKANNSEVKLSGFFLGATAATISKRPSGYTISFAGGMAKLRVNGEVVRESIELKDFDTIELGSHKFQFYEREKQIT